MANESRKNKIFYDQGKLIINSTMKLPIQFKKKVAYKLKKPNNFLKYL